MAFKIENNIYADENFSISKSGGIHVYGTANMDDIKKVFEKLFPDRVIIYKNGNKIIDLNGL